MELRIEGNPGSRFATGSSYMQLERGLEISKRGITNSNFGNTNSLLQNSSMFLHGSRNRRMTDIHIAALTRERLDGTSCMRPHSCLSLNDPHVLWPSLLPMRHRDAHVSSTRSRTSSARRSSPSLLPQLRHLTFASFIFETDDVDYFIKVAEFSFLCLDLATATDGCTTVGGHESLF
ncbi:hypothetical protein BDZ97DRAFT_1811395 [Flammula alnicola]|nr:hypothetical protein BDZ97DRAFT_1811395 [Flammula alnicola]